MIQKISPFLWFDGNAEEAANFYTSIFPDSRITNISRNAKGMPGEEGAVLTVSFQLFGQNFVALNGGPIYKFTEAISFMVTCDNQEEVDRYWDGLLADGGQPVQCGWLKDKFGLSWQVTPNALMQILGSASSEARDRVMAAMMQMVKLDIATLEAAAKGK